MDLINYFFPPIKYGHPGLTLHYNHVQLYCHYCVDGTSDIKHLAKKNII